MPLLGCQDWEDPKRNELASMFRDIVLETGPLTEVGLPDPTVRGTSSADVAALRMPGILRFDRFNRHRLRDVGQRPDRPYKHDRPKEHERRQVGCEVGRLPADVSGFAEGEIRGTDAGPVAGRVPRDGEGRAARGGRHRRRERLSGPCRREPSRRKVVVDAVTDGVDQLGPEDW
jgi:hypothetical protein